MDMSCILLAVFVYSCAMSEPLFSSKNVLEHSQPLSLLSLMMILLPTFKSPNAVFC